MGHKSDCRHWQACTSLLLCLVFLHLISSSSMSDECSFCPSFPILQLEPSLTLHAPVSMLLSLQLPSVVLLTVVCACGLPVTTSQVPLWTFMLWLIWSLRLIFELYNCLALHLARGFGGTICPFWAALLAAWTPDLWKSFLHPAFNWIVMSKYWRFPWNVASEILRSEQLKPLQPPWSPQPLWWV